MTPPLLALLVLVVPLGSAVLIAGFLRRRHSLAAGVSVLASALSAAGAFYLAFSGLRFQVAKEWFDLGSLTVTLGFKFDDLAALMLAIVALIGLCVHVFSLGYMSHDAGKARYFGGLSVFLFSMNGIVLADNLFMMFIFWELVGFSSWLLINHWYERPAAAAAAKKAFIVNRVGDFGFLLGIIYCFWAHGTVNFTDLAVQTDSGHDIFSRAIPLLLFCGAVGKSAQMPLQVWLPDAMEGPTPVSALIHAATMVAAGVFMLCRIHMLMVPQALVVIRWVGAATALYAALCAITQEDIKKVLAYSTLSQLGYMVAAFGLGSLEPHGAGRWIALAGVAAAMFHLMTHAFFKGLLFLGSGSVIHGCDDQNIFRMGGLAGRMKLTFVTFTIAVGAITGLPFLAGFFSKDAILYLAYANDRAVFAVLAFTAALTAFYMIRMWKLVFLGAPRSDGAAHAHESGPSMAAPMVVLAILAAIGGYRGVYGRVFSGVFDSIPEAPHGPQLRILAIGVGMFVIGTGAALGFYRSQAEDRLSEVFPGLYGALCALRESFDAAYDAYVAKVQQRAAMVLNFIDQIFVAGLLVRGVAGVVGLVGLGVRALHVGRVNAYVLWFLGGAVILWAFAVGIL